MIAFGQNIQPHPEVPKHSNWRNKRSKRAVIVIASSSTHVLYQEAIDGGHYSRTVQVSRWLAHYERVEISS